VCESGIIKRWLHHPYHDVIKRPLFQEENSAAAALYRLSRQNFSQKITDEFWHKAESVKDEKLIWTRLAFACARPDPNLRADWERKVCIVIFHVLWFPRRPLSSLSLSLSPSPKWWRAVLKCSASLKINSRGALCAMPAVIAPGGWNFIADVNTPECYHCTCSYGTASRFSAAQLHYSRAPDSLSFSLSLSDFGLQVVISLCASVPIAESGFFIFIFAPITSTRSLIVACERAAPAKTRIPQAGIPEDAQNLTSSDKCDNKSI